MDPARPAHDVEKGPQVPLNVAIHRQLHDYQKVAKDFIMTRPKSGLFLDGRQYPGHRPESHRPLHVDRRAQRLEDTGQLDVPHR